MQLETRSCEKCGLERTLNWYHLSGGVRSTICKRCSTKEDVHDDMHFQLTQRRYLQELTARCKIDRQVARTRVNLSKETL
jgi:hypothetical protein